MLTLAEALSNMLFVSCCPDASITVEQVKSGLIRTTRPFSVPPESNLYVPEQTEVFFPDYPQ